MKQEAEKAYREHARSMQQMFDRLGPELKGQSIDVVKTRLQREWQRSGDRLTDPELTDFATALSEGAEVKLDVQPLRW